MKGIYKLGIVVLVLLTITTPSSAFTEIGDNITVANNVTAQNFLGNLNWAYLLGVPADFPNSTVASYSGNFPNSTLSGYGNNFPNNTVASKEASWDAKTTLATVNTSALLQSITQVNGLQGLFDNLNTSKINKTDYNNNFPNNTLANYGNNFPNSTISTKEATWDATTSTVNGNLITWNSTYNATYDAKPSSTFNSTYDATTSTVNGNLITWNSTYNATYDAKPSSTFNSTYDATTSTVNGNLITWNSTYNATYDAKSNFSINVSGQPQIYNAASLIAGDNEH